ncbi:MAG: RluA family pseudouridine synthase [Polyangia bacterium]
MPLASDDRPTTITHRFVVEAECDGWRLDRFLQKRIPRLSRARVQRVIRGECWLDERACRPSSPVLPGQVVRFIRPAPIEPEVPRTLPVLYTDASFYVVDKPAGIAMHPTAKFHYATVTAVLRELFPTEKLEICHRLDLETSGALVVARTKEATIAIKKSFARRHVDKTYVAVSHWPEGLDETGVIDLPLGLEEKGLTRVKMVVTPVDRGGLPSRTRYEVLERRGSYALVQCHPETGRQHQIRAHLDAIGAPIVADKLYPDAQIFVDYQDHGWEAVEDRVPLRRHALHAHRIVFPHPLTNEPVEICSPLPCELRALFDGVTADA